MRKREFNKLLKLITVGRGLRERLDVDLIPSRLATDERHAMVEYLVRNRGPLIVELIPDSIDSSWLDACAYMYYTTARGYHWRHTSENAPRP